MRHKLSIFATVLGLLLLASSARLAQSVRVDGMALLDQPAGPGSHPALLTAPEAAPSSTVGCGDTITSDTTLTSDLTDCPGNGLIIGADNITLDCAGHTIDGDGSGGGDGIVVSGRSWDTIKNCTVTDFAYGISLSWSSNNTLTDNTANSNDYGFFVSDSDSNTLTGSTASGNLYDGIYLQSSYTNTNNTLSGSTVRDNVWAGVQLGGNFNTLSGSTIRNNGGAGVYVGATNTLNSSVVCSNKLDISGSGSNSGDDNTCMSTNNWNDGGTIGCTFSCPLEPVCYCSSCSECNEKLAADCPVVELTADIVDQSGTCINQTSTFNGEVFDCQGHTIDGDDSGAYGILLYWRSWDTIKNCTVTDFVSGIGLSYSSNNTLTDNTANSNYYYGFTLSDSDSNTLTGSTANANPLSGIYLSSCSNNTLSGSTMRDNRYVGLRLDNGYDNSITGSTIRNNGGTGVSLHGVSGNILNSNEVCSNQLDIDNLSGSSGSGDDNTCMSTDNWNDAGTEGCTSSCPLEPVCYCSTCSECNEKLADDCPVVKLTADITDQSLGCIGQFETFNGEVFDCQGHTIDGDGSLDGIFVDQRFWDTIENCKVTDFAYGITLNYSRNNTLRNNTVNGNLYDGIGLWNSSNNTLSGSTMRDNGGTGLSVVGINNSIYNNYFSNAHNVTASGTNTWNIAKTAGTNIFGGPYLGGNFWSDYGGVDTNGDGLGNTGLPYNANGNIQNGGDYLPLVPVSGGPVGGIAELPDAHVDAAGTKSSQSAPRTLPVAGLAAGSALLLAAGGWYARRRRRAG